MECFVHRHELGRGWSNGLPPAPNDTPATLVLVFASPRYANEAAFFDDLHARFPRGVVMGCSTAGEIDDDRVYEDTAVVTVLRFARTELRVAERPIEAAGESEAVGREVARALAGPSLRALFVLSDGKRVNGSALVAGINAVVSREVIVTGGLAADGFDFKQTWVIGPNGATHGLVTAVGFYGDHVEVAHGYGGGFTPFGPERAITKSQGNVLYEIDHRPALEQYSSYLGDRAAGLPATALLFPLVIRAPDGATRLVRTILDIDAEQRTMSFAGDVPEGHRGQLMRANIDNLVQGASDAAETAAQAGSAPDRVCVSISCVGRRLVLGPRADEELQAVLDAFTPGVRQVGFYSYGELAPQGSGPCELHNQTMTVTTIGERL